MHKNMRFVHEINDITVGPNPFTNMPGGRDLGSHPWWVNGMARKTTNHETDRRYFPVEEPSSWLFGAIITHRYTSQTLSTIDWLYTTVEDGNCPSIHIYNPVSVMKKVLEFCHWISILCSVYIEMITQAQNPININWPWRNQHSKFLLCSDIEIAYIFPPQLACLSTLKSKYFFHKFDCRSTNDRPTWGHDSNVSKRCVLLHAMLNIFVNVAPTTRMTIASALNDFMNKVSRTGQTICDSWLHYRISTFAGLSDR